ncbi:hypothetical protein SAMN05216352_10768 [Alteribacillus bidgolensis]|uniref:Uncharacterized protein n=1 Tax=Alteribacillus bidgolensis TaxID=930129 RepID=A0A1G8K6M8_9BACI|nr:hypothetical protein SAMN05216352_10768 [Alteribacillus bidgolensis]
MGRMKYHIKNVSLEISCVWGDFEQVLIIAIDAAKLYQKAFICYYLGDVIERPLFFSIY